MSPRTLNLQALHSSVTYCLSFYHRGYLWPQSPYLADFPQDPLEFFQLAAFCSMHLAPGRNPHTLISPNISGCYISLFSKGSSRWEESSVYPYLRPQILRTSFTKDSQAGPQRQGWVGLWVSAVQPLGKRQMLVSPSGRQQPWFWVILKFPLLAWSGEVHISWMKMLGGQSKKFSRICVDTTWEYECARNLWI